MPDILSAQDLTATRAAIRASRSAQDRTLLDPIRKKARLPSNQQKSATARARLLVDQIRKAGNKRHKQANSPEELLALYGTDHKEGLTLLELAAILPDIPDKATRDLFISDHLQGHDWSLPDNVDESLMMRATSGALTLAKDILAGKEIASRLGRPVIRSALQEAAHLLADHFVLAENPVEALRRSSKTRDKGGLFSFYFPRKSLRSKKAARDYFKACANAVDILTLQDEPTRGQVSITVKLTALAPFADNRHWQLGRRNLLERLHALCNYCARDDLTLILDAEESVHTDILLEVVDYIAAAPDLRDWQGFGLTLQACDKGAAILLDHLAVTADKNDRLFHIRLTKGILWAKEMEHAARHDLVPPPIFQDKSSTDENYIALARTILEQKGKLLGGFATHDARCIARIAEHATRMKNHLFEFQMLYGIGDNLRRQLVRDGFNCRIIAPVGPHTAVMDNILDQLKERGTGPGMLQTAGQTEDSKEGLPDIAERTGFLPGTGYMSDIIRLGKWLKEAPDQEMMDPAPADAALALSLSNKAAKDWQKRSTSERVGFIRRLATEFESGRTDLFRWLVETAHLPWESALNEIRLASRFCRETADAVDDMTSRVGIALHLFPKEVVAANPHMSRPLSDLFRIAAPAIVAGNPVIFSCSHVLPQQLFTNAGIPDDLVQPLAPKSMQDLGLDIVDFQPGHSIILADSSCDRDRLAEDAATGAFHMSGQDNLALRWLLVQEDIADDLLVQIAGAMDCLIVGDPADPATDMPPLATKAAVERSHAHINSLHGQLHHIPRRRFDPQTGNHVLPHLVEVTSLDAVPAPPRGPVLHVIRWKPEDLPIIYEQIGLNRAIRSVGIYSRIARRIEDWMGRFDCDHLSINRNPALAENAHKPIHPQRFARIQKVHRDADFFSLLSGEKSF